VVCFDQTKRHSRNASSLNTNSTNAFAAPVSRVHCDYTKESGIKRLEQLATTNERILYLKSRAKHFAFFNLWRSIDREFPVQEWPLALLDPRTGPTDLDNHDQVLIYELVFPHRVGLNYSLPPHSRGHNWFFFPHMTHTEAILFSVFDSDYPKRPGFVFHSAFDLPSRRFEKSCCYHNEAQALELLSPIEAPHPRKSLEVRTIVFFEN